METTFPTPLTASAVLSLKYILDNARVALATADSCIKQVELLISGDEQVQHPV